MGYSFAKPQSARATAATLARMSRRVPEDQNIRIVPHVAGCCAKVDDGPCFGANVPVGVTWAITSPGCAHIRGFVKVDVLRMGGELPPALGHGQPSSISLAMTSLRQVENLFWRKRYCISSDA